MTIGILPLVHICEVFSSLIKYSLINRKDLPHFLLTLDRKVQSEVGKDCFLQLLPIAKQHQWRRIINGIITFHTVIFDREKFSITVF